MPGRMFFSGCPGPSSLPSPSSSRSSLCSARRFSASTQRRSAETELAAELSGISAVKYGWILFVIVGFFAAAAGVARASYMSLGDPLSGDQMELACIIAVLLGGTAFSGGEGSVAKTMVGAIIIVMRDDGLDDGHPCLLADPGDGQCAPHCGGQSITCCRGIN